MYNFEKMFKILVVNRLQTDFVVVVVLIPLITVSSGPLFSLFSVFFLTD